MLFINITIKYNNILYKLIYLNLFYNKINNNNYSI